MKIVGHHACANKGENPQVIELQGPFFSKHVEGNTKQYKFLGSGYYFWDNNRGRAHVHGLTNYRREYHIFEGEIVIEEDTFLDLAGNRIDMLHFQELMKRLHQEIEESKTWGIAQFIAFFQKKKLFPYRAIRAIDTNSNPKAGRDSVHFVPDRTNFINLNPIFILCLLDTKTDMLISFKHLVTFPTNG
jgi:hypothetical protein